MRLCTKCNESKEEEDFYADKRRKKKLNGLCKKCHYEYTRNYYLNNKDKVHLIGKKSRWKAQGINVEQAIYTLNTQTKCQVCHTDTDLVLDHCHLTKEVRGMLCQSCNKGLGAFNDNRDVILAAANYLNRVK